jgi:CRISPR system Cascade subunit CasE
MYFSLIRLRRNVLPKDVVALGNGNAYQLHKLIWNLFSDGPDRRRDFLYRYEAVHGCLTFYTVSAREPNDPSDLWEIHSKQYTPKISKGERLAFSVRVNPVCSKRDERRRRQRHDVVMEAKRRIAFKELPHQERPHVATLVQEAGLAWLKAREVGLGFHVEGNNEAPMVRADGYVQHKLFRGKGVEAVDFHTLDFNGVLTVTDPDIFIKECLYKGIGPAKGFGCGLMMVRRIT